MYHPLRQFLLFFLVAHIVHGSVRVELDDGKVVTVDDEKRITPTIESDHGHPGARGVSARDLFGRQYCSAPGQNVICGGGCCPNSNYCCERTSCIDMSVRICCPNGRQCQKGGQCCRGGNCCAPGRYCVRDLDTGERGCLPYGGSRSSTRPLTGGTTPAPSLTTRQQIISTRTPYSCRSAGYSLCPNQRFCCPGGDYCYYNVNNAPRCWRSSYYAFWYTYSWSFSNQGIRWFTTTSTYTLTGPTVVALSTPPPPTVAPSASAGATVPGPAPTNPGASSTPTETGTGTANPAAVSETSSADEDSTTADLTAGSSDAVATAAFAGTGSTATASETTTGTTATSKSTATATATATRSVAPFVGGTGGGMAEMLVRGWTVLVVVVGVVFGAAVIL